MPGRSKESKLWLFFIVLLVVVIVSALLVLIFDGQKRGGRQEEASDTGFGFSAGETEIDLGNGIVITGIGRYAGMYMEDSTNEPVSGVLMIFVTNRSEKTLQYGEITLWGTNDAHFSISTLSPGANMVALETSRLPYAADGGYTSGTLSSVVFFDAEPTLCGDKLWIETLDKTFQITNITDSQIEGDIVIYYKNYRDGVFYGGITYRVRLSGGLKPGETRQVFSSHYTVSGSQIVFVTCS